MPLAPYAMDVRRTRGRRHREAPHPYRNEYARDRDRVIHSRAFRRLEAKTQVFTTRFSDHFRNRLTHTLEVTQIARTAASALDLNADLTEALALVHDIGHPPFGHAGERQLDRRMREYSDRFDHNLHALRIVEHFEQRYLDFPGLNLTFELREGIIKHSREHFPEAQAELAEYLLELRPPIEAQLIDLADEIAYDTADLDDSFEARMLDFNSLRNEVPLFERFYAPIETQHPNGRFKLKFNEALKGALNFLVTDLIDHTRNQVLESGVAGEEDVRHYRSRLAEFSAEAREQMSDLKQFLGKHIYSHQSIVEDRERSVQALDRLFSFFMQHPDRMPKYYSEQAQNGPLHRVVCDYIAGMTDSFLLRQHSEHLGELADLHC
jgi:dGTPase